MVELATHIATVRAGEGDPIAMIGEFRRTPVLVPVSEGRFMSAEYGGIRWLYAFTDQEALARFALVRGAAPDEAWEYLAMLGARLLDVLVPQMDGPAGVAMDVADENGSMMFPPMKGIVPDEVALDGGRNGGHGMDGFH